ncbi:hypothetical protein ymoll0001_24970 [Yersinia mollaretii ATCC 43969]|uniref:Uncharacterized protein n=1 Tax=Yersinia mollaretii (strain ATCC 43969 / DSM 18520 / CIP 103324 / CNY 7263 / WAIP 204) TaxID=349967 RepID=A0ABM9YDN6_YERMW|nr:hypothetical protein ymoll0001_24970 [Yersinia mollaretii ATCC 43969]
MTLLLRFLPCGNANDFGYYELMNSGLWRNKLSKISDRVKQHSSCRVASMT